MKTLIDSGCSCTIFTERWMFQDFVEYVAAIKTAGGTIYSEGRGTVGKLQNCLYLPSMDVNLISSGHAVEHIPNLEIAQQAGPCITRDLQNRNADKVFRTEDRLCEVEDLTWMGVPDYTGGHYAYIHDDINNQKIYYLQQVIMDGLKDQVDSCRDSMGTHG